jgi:signal transduction histidine kinase
LPGGRTVHVASEPRNDGGLTYLFDDVTERLALESRYNAAMRTQRGTLDTLREGVAVFGTDGRLKLFNPAFARFWRLSPIDLEREPHIDEVVRRCRMLYDDEATWQRLQRAVTSITDKRQRLEGLMKRPDDSVIAFAGLPLPDGSLLLTFVDVTDSARAERMLRERNEALVQADKLKTQFIGLVSYALRTPLNDIIGFSELLESPLVGQLNGRQRGYLQDIASSSRTLRAIIDDILDLASIDANAFELRLGQVRIDDVIRGATAAVEEQLTQKGIKLKTVSKLATDEFIADEHRVKQVLYNLLSNAIGFSKRGDTITLDSFREDGHIAFRVADQGIGIPPDEQESVFDRFVSRPQGSLHRGVGLGLSLVKSLVELHGGQVSLTSEPGRGTLVTVIFPTDPTKVLKRDG